MELVESNKEEQEDLRQLGTYPAKQLHEDVFEAQVQLPPLAVQPHATLVPSA